MALNYTERQKALVKEAHEKVQPNADKLGKTYFSKIFQKDPSLKDKFSFLRTEGANYESPEDHPKIKSHATTVMKMITDSALQIAENGKVKIDPAALQRMAKAHNTNNVVEKDFPVYDSSANETLKDYFTEDHGDALKKAHEELIAQMQDAQAHVKLMQQMKDDIGALMAAAYSTRF